MSPPRRYYRQHYFIFPSHAPGDSPQPHIFSLRPQLKNTRRAASPRPKTPRKRCQLEEDDKGGATQHERGGRTTLRGVRLFVFELWGPFQMLGVELCPSLNPSSGSRTEVRPPLSLPLPRPHRHHRLPHLPPLPPPPSPPIRLPFHHPLLMECSHGTCHDLACVIMSCLATWGHAVPMCQIQDSQGNVNATSGKISISHEHTARSAGVQPSMCSAGQHQRHKYRSRTRCPTVGTSQMCVVTAPSEQQPGYIVGSSTSKIIISRTTSRLLAPQ